MEAATDLPRLRAGAMVNRTPAARSGRAGARASAQTERRLSAEDLPVLRWATFSWAIFCPSLRVCMPARSTALMCTNTSFPPSSGWMNPNPFWLLNHFTVPCVISLLFRYCACGAAPGGRLRSFRVLEEGRQSDALVAARPSRSAEARSRKCTPWGPVPQGRELANHAGDQESVSERRKV